MTDLALQFAAGNLIVSIILAAFAWSVQRFMRRAVLAHLLWVLVLVKLVTPPLWHLPVFPAEAAAAVSPIADDPRPDAVALVGAADAATPCDISDVLLWLWLIGSGSVLIVSFVRIARFHRLLAASSTPAPVVLDRLAADLGHRLGLRAGPAILITSANLSPMVWWIGGRVNLVVPEALSRALSAEQLRWVLAHELCHVRRGDHFVRWLEWIVCVGFWWNPIVWLARRNLRANEEVCCDALVLRTFRPRPRTYANSLLQVVEFLAAPAVRPPALASRIDSGGFLERRLRMIVSRTEIAATPRWLQAAVALATLTLMPLGIGHAQNPDVGAVGKRLRAAVQAGELTPRQAREMLRVLRHSSSEEGEAEARREVVRRDREAERAARGQRELDVADRDARRRGVELDRQRVEIEKDRARERAGRLRVEAEDRQESERRSAVQELEMAHQQLRQHAEHAHRQLEQAHQQLAEHEASLDRRLAEQAEQIHAQLEAARRQLAEQQQALERASGEEAETLRRHLVEAHDRVAADEARIAEQMQQKTEVMRARLEAAHRRLVERENALDQNMDQYAAELRRHLEGALLEHGDHERNGESQPHQQDIEKALRAAVERVHAKVRAAESGGEEKKVEAEGDRGARRHIIR
ncbi:MAG: hypothetical protein KDC98_07110 [Planctomycetes bacterium]|nr:hypothetical protein [Planctomycetota bacterium]